MSGVFADDFWERGQCADHLLTLSGNGFTTSVGWSEDCEDAVSGSDEDGALEVIGGRENRPKVFSTFSPLRYALTTQYRPFLGPVIHFQALSMWLRGSLNCASQPRTALALAGLQMSSGGSP
ncbi:MAG TPA: hypothetical protein VK171_06790, partial [Fimbriimonas sp.]|nr:hypothetical protein [Fimbriimonas sp.]